MRVETVCGGACEYDEDKDEDVKDEGGAAHAHGDCVGGACEDDEDKDEDVEDEGGAAHAHGYRVRVPVKMTRTSTRTWRTRLVLRMRMETLWGACKDDEDKDEDVKDEGGAAHAHGDCVWGCL
jgi:hypothetical protein